jgi:hypothetical protein
MLFVFLQITINLSHGQSFQNLQPSTNDAIPLLVSRDPTLDHVTKIDSWINNANALQLYRERRSADKSTALSKHNT